MPTSLPVEWTQTRDCLGGCSRIEPCVSINLKCEADYRCITTLSFSPYLRVFLHRVGNRIVAQPALSCPPLPARLHVPVKSPVWMLAANSARQTNPVDLISRLEHTDSMIVTLEGG